jgi:hypothetical protein
MIAQILIRQRGVFVLVGSSEVVCVELHDLLQTGSIVLIHAQCLGVKRVFLDVFLHFIKRLEILEMCKRLESTLQLVINTILATKRRQILQ